MTVEELIAMLEMQEEILQFNHFTNEDAWELEISWWQRPDEERCQWSSASA